MSESPSSSADVDGRLRSFSAMSYREIHSMRTSIAEISDGTSAPKSVIERSFLLLRCFQCGESSLTLAELTRRSALPKPTVYRLANALVDVHALERTKGGFRLGIYMFELGGMVPRWRILREAALPFLCDLYSAARLTVHLAILSDTDVLYIEKIRGHHDPALGSRIGGTLPAHATSTGRALLAHVPASIVDSVLDGPLEQTTQHTCTDADQLRLLLADVAENGYALECDEARVGMRNIAAPVLNWKGEAVASIALSMSADADHVPYVKPLIATARAVSNVLPTSAYL